VTNFAAVLFCATSRIQPTRGVPNFDDNLRDARDRGPNLIEACWRG
jgi:hypothetical protein